jgi:hypothetical protein
MLPVNCQELYSEAGEFHGETGVQERGSGASRCDHSFPADFKKSTLESASACELEDHGLKTKLQRKFLAHTGMQADGKLTEQLWLPQRPPRSDKVLLPARPRRRGASVWLSDKVLRSTLSL